MRKTIAKYGTHWDAAMTDLEIEFQCIRLGGSWKNKNGTVAGMGLFHHYREAQSILWPSDEHNRWSDLILDNILTNCVTVVMGPKSSAKTHTAAKFVLLDYFLWPDKTTMLVSSTDLRGLELRVWGDLKALMKVARESHPELPGNVLESKHCIATDQISDDGFRDMRNGIICIPCLSTSGTWVGLGRYVGIKNKRVRLVADECFPGDALVDTPRGPVPIQTLKTGDEVLSAAGPARVKDTMTRVVKQLVRVRLSTGQQIDCTANHPFLTLCGWKKAVDLNPSDCLLSCNETMQILRQGDSEQGFLFRELQREMDHFNPGWTEPVLHSRTRVQTQRVETSMAPGTPGGCRMVQSADAASVSRRTGQAFSKSKCFAQGHWLETSGSARQWLGSNRTRAIAALKTFGVSEQLSHPDGRAPGFRISPALQGRRGAPVTQACHRTRWGVAFQFFEAKTGPEKNGKIRGVRVDSVEVLEPSGDSRYSERDGGYRVHNLAVEGHPSYSVGGVIVHNCQHMQSSFLDAVSNLDSNPDFKAVFLGNPLDVSDSLGRAAEPKDGWNSIGEPTKTTVWQSRFLDGVTINLVGTDSPNFDFPSDKPPRYPYLIHRGKIASTVSFYGVNSHQYYSQCLGVMKVGANARRVITREMVKQFAAQEEVVWDGPTTKIYAIDPAYGNIGGDRCVGGYIEFGKELEGKTVIAVGSPKIIPVSYRNTGMPEDQIAQYVRDECERLEILPGNVFFDSTGRGSLGTAFARLWSPDVNPVEFGGTASNRPVSLDLHIRDGVTGLRRLKLCREHYSKFVTELWFSWRYCIESGQIRSLPSEVVDEGCMREWKMVRGDRIEIETKDETKERMGRSPDMADWLVTAIEGARRKGFVIVKLSTDAGDDEPDWLSDLKQKARDWHRLGRLNHAA